MLEKILHNAWKDVGKDYENGLINSERCMQTVLYNALRNTLSGMNIFVEPIINLGNERNIIPDIVICNKDKIEVVLELKFVPHYRPEFKKDIKNLYKLAQLAPKQIQIKLDPRTGEFTGEHSVYDKSLFVFAAIGRNDSEAVYRESIVSNFDNALPQNFRLYYGRIDPKGEPDFANFGVE